MSAPQVILERRDNVLIAHLDDGKANAVSTEMISALLEAIDQAEGDATIAALVLNGREGRFSAGFDLGVMRSGDLAAISTLVTDGGALVHRLYGCGVPVVAACTGHALAAGALMLLGCDVRIGASGDYKIGLNEVAIGMVMPPWAMTISAERLSKRHLQRAVATSQITDGDGAVQAGFLDEVVPPERVLDTAVAVGSAFAALDRRAYAGTVRALRRATLEAMAQQIADDRARGTVPTV
jgi:enoyl-CoA hydratase